MVFGLVETDISDDDVNNIAKNIYLLFSEKILFLVHISKFLRTNDESSTLKNI